MRRGEREREGEGKEGEGREGGDRGRGRERGRVHLSILEKANRLPKKEIMIEILFSKSNQLLKVILTSHTPRDDT